MNKPIEEFFDKCERGKGWEECSAYCIPNATFECDVMPDIKTI